MTSWHTLLDLVRVQEAPTDNRRKQTNPHMDHKLAPATSDEPTKPGGPLRREVKDSKICNEHGTQNWHPLSWVTRLHPEFRGAAEHCGGRQKVIVATPESELKTCQLFTSMPSQRIFTFYVASFSAESNTD